MKKIRFSENRKKRRSPFLLAAAVILFLYAAEAAGEMNGGRQKEYLEDAITRGIICCYASTGKYPDSLETLETEYGLMYNKKKFYVDYRAIGSNIYPQIVILEKE